MRIDSEGWTHVGRRPHNEDAWTSRADLGLFVVADGMGGYRMEWRALGILYARMRAGSGTERQGEVGAESVVQWRITVRGARDCDPHGVCYADDYSCRDDDRGGRCD